MTKFSRYHSTYKINLWIQCLPFILIKKSFINYRSTQKRVFNKANKEMFHKTLTVLHLGSSENLLARIQVRESKTISNSFPHHFALQSTPLLMLHSDSLPTRGLLWHGKFLFVSLLFTHTLIRSLQIVNQDTFPIILAWVKYLSSIASILVCLKGFF